MQSKKIYPLASDTWDQEEIKSILRVIESGRYTMGPEVEKFESQFAEHFGSRYAVMTNSGSSANLISIATLAQNPQYKNKGNIIVPAVSWSTTYFPVHQWGYTLRFVDVDPNTFNIRTDLVEQAIDADTAAVFAVNLLGSAAELSKLREICDRNDIALIEDNCESLGASENNKYCGAVGDMGTFSFFFSHHMQTMEGGMVLTNDDDTADYLRSMRAHGWVRDLKNNNSLYDFTGDDFEDSFRFVLPGYCVRPLEMSGAIGQAQLTKWPSMMRKRRNNAQIAQALFPTVNGVRLQQENGTSSWFGFGLVLEEHLSGQRKKVIDKLKSAGVETRPIVAGNFMRNPVIDRLRWDSVGTFEAADDLHDNGFFIGNDSQDLRTGIETVYNILKEFE